MLIQRLPQRGVAPRWLKPIARKVTAGHQIEGKRERLDVLTWNRRLSKAGNGCRVGANQHKRYANGVGYGLPIVEEENRLKVFQRFRIRKDRSENGYRTVNKYCDPSGAPQRATRYFVEDIVTGQRVSDPDILAGVVKIANDNRKWPYVPDQPTNVRRSGEKKKYQARYAIGKPSRNSHRAHIVFEKPGPSRLFPHHLGLPCQCCEKTCTV